MYFTSNIKFLRKRRGRTQDDVAFALNLKRSTLSGYENGLHPAAEGRGGPGGDGGEERGEPQPVRGRSSARGSAGRWRGLAQDAARSAGRPGVLMPRAGMTDSSPGQATADFAVGMREAKADAMLARGGAGTPVCA